MKDELFNNVLANSFNDTQENIDWLADNDYIVLSGTVFKKYLYAINKDFKWTGTSYSLEGFITSEYINHEG